MKKLIWQNVTEGELTDELANAAIVFLSEVSLPRLRRRRSRKNFRTITSRKTPGLAISVDRREFKVVTRGAVRFHGSGKGEHWDGIATPARGLLYVVGYWKDDPQKRLYGYWVTWFLNSWNPKGNRDQWTEQREWIVRHLSIPVVEKFVRKLLKETEVIGVLGGGDTNSIRWNGNLEGMDPIFNQGLDRLWTAGEIEVEYAGKTPKTGAGSQMQHEGIAVDQQIRKLKEGRP